MPPHRTKRDRNSATSSSKGETSKAVAIQSPDVARTPERTSARQGPNVTTAQKQALIDNLQLEITERARKLRAQYALHAQGLRSRLEMRINRIPQTLRLTNIEELIDRYSEQLEPPNAPPLLSAKGTAAKTTAALRAPALPSSSPARARGMKRPSSEMAGQSDKENRQLDLDMPKKRTKIAPMATAAPTRAVRATSRKVDPSKVLSPKSHNSRTLPQSPFRAPASPGKSYLARPLSPAKPGPASVAAATASLASLVGPEKVSKAGRARTTSKQTASTASNTRGRRAPPQTAMAPPPPPKQTRGRAASNSSQNSNTSAGTTIVRKAMAARRGIVGKVTGMTATGRKAAAKKEVPVPTATGTGGRVLRARR